jgi:hypothetical protein
MTVSVAFDGNVIDNADTVGNWTAIKITSGGQAPTAVAADAPYEGLNNVTCRSDNKRVYMYTDIGSGNELDFTGAQAGQFFGIWVNFLASSLLEDLIDGGLGIFMSTNTPSSSNYALWYMKGADNYNGGWVRLVIDPTKAPSVDNDSFDPTSVRYFGAFAHTNATAKFDNFVVDMCSHGKGLIVTGTSTLGLTEELLADELVNRHGVLTALNDSGTAAQLLGKLTLGDDVGTDASAITDEDSKIFIAEPLFYETTLKPALPLTAQGLVIVGNGTGDTDVAFGIAVGAVAGRNGMAIVGNDTYEFVVDRDDGAVESANFYGCSLENLTGMLDLDGTHDFNGNSVIACGPITVHSDVSMLSSVGSGAITLSSGAQLLNSLIINNVDASAVIAPTLADVINVAFTSDGSNHAVDCGNIPSNQSMDWDNTESGYVAGSAGAGVDDKSPTGNETIICDVDDGFTLTINVAATGSTPSVGNIGLGDVDVVAGQRTFAFTLNPSITNYEWRLYEASGVPGDGTIGTVELDGEEVASADNQSYAYTWSSDTDIAVQIFADGYEEFLHYDTLGNGDKDLTFNLTPETN